MSLKSVHVFLIGCSIGVSVFFAVWSWSFRRDALIFCLGAAALLLAFVLSGYLAYFLNKTKRLSL